MKNVVIITGGTGGYALLSGIKKEELILNVLSTLLMMEDQQEFLEENCIYSPQEILNSV